MMGLPVSEDELRALLVTQLEILTPAEFENAQAMSKRLRTTVGAILVDRGIPQGFLLEQLARAWRISYIDLKVSDVKLQALQLVDEEFARSNALIPFEVQDGRLKLAMRDPRDQEIMERVRRKTKLKVEPYLAPAPSILRAHLLYKGDLREMLKRLSIGGISAVSRSQPTDEPAARPSVLLDRMLDYAVVTKASDIHIEPYETETLVRCRIDGVLHEISTLTPETSTALVSRIKVLAGMRIDERRAPQDGRFDVNVSGLKFDLRVSSLPTRWGEKVVMRVLSKEFLTFDLEDLGLTPSDYDIVLRYILRPHGMILITGPTGSGKSTTLYAMLTRLGAERKYVVNISTVEDPVEYTLPRVNQTSVIPASGLTFPTALRALLRQDPDIIMVGEIRDLETAEIATHAALVGRLLFSTLHTNDATGVVVRMLDIGIEPFLLASSLTLALSQRLVRRICTNCRESIPPPPPAIAALKARPDFDATIHALQSQNALGTGEDPLSGIRLFKGKGCAQCQGTGFRGRLGVFELFEITDNIRTMIMERRDSSSIRAAAIAGGMRTLFQDGLAKVFLGQTSLEEIARVSL